MKLSVLLSALIIGSSTYAFDSKFANTSIQEIKTLKDGYNRYRYITWTESIYPQVAIEAIENGSEGDLDKVLLSLDVTKKLSQKYRGDFIHLSYAKNAISDFKMVGDKAIFKLKVVGRRVGELSCDVSFDIRDFDLDCYYE